MFGSNAEPGRRTTIATAMRQEGGGAMVVEIKREVGLFAIRIQFLSKIMVPKMRTMRR